MRPNICFCATGKTGLGHLRRLTNIATALARRAPDVPLQLITNAATEGLGAQELTLYQRIQQVPRPEMSAALAAQPPSLVVVDTAVIPDLARLSSRLCLILREARADTLERFQLQDERQWDLLLYPNPASEWSPPPALVPAKRRRAVGWIYRRASPQPGQRLSLGAPPAAATRQLLIATGGGGSGTPWEQFRAETPALIQALRQRLSLEVIQVLGPRADDSARLAGVDRIVRPGSRLNELFSQADLVISTVGYNSTLELADSDVPVLMMAIPATYDDQAGRARRWQSRLGWAYQNGQQQACLDWAIGVLSQGRRRPPVTLGDSGADLAATELLELLGE